MARYVKKQIRGERKTSFKGKTYIVFHYLLDDGSEVTSLQKFNAGDRVEVWFDDAWGIPKMKLYDEH